MARSDELKTYLTEYRAAEVPDPMLAPSGPALRCQCIKTTGGYWAFLPALLPPVRNIDLAMINALSRADSALGTLAGRLARPAYAGRP